ncbi:MAG: hypothetical protein JST30_02845 [Armatimonadetes bacterium]|nr:hypothetical protein [Armatimonadota bacterium]
MNRTVSRENFLIFCASLLIAVGVLLSFPSNAAPGFQDIDARIEYTGLPEGLILVDEPKTFKVRASGTSTHLRQLDADAVSVTVNLASARKGVSSYPVEVVAPNRRGVSVGPRDTSSLRLDVQNVSSIEAKVDIEPTGLPPRDLIYDSATVLPEKVTLIGPASALPLVKKARVILDLAAIRPGATLMVPVEILGDGNRRVSHVRAEPAEVTVSPAVAAAPASKSALVSPTWTGQPAFGYRVESVDVRPAQVQVGGESAVLARLSVLKTSPVSLEGQQKDFTTSAKVVFPDGVKPAGAREVRVTVRIVRDAERRP